MSFWQWVASIVLILVILSNSWGWYLDRKIEEQCVKSSWRVYDRFDTLQDIYECGNGKTYIVK